jgi:probable HAF family extracellular repeat protein
MRTSISRTLVAAWLVTLVAMLDPASARAGQFDPFYETSFQSADSVFGRWSIAAGTWQVVDQEFRTSSTSGISLATVTTYDPDVPPHDVIGGSLTLDVYLFIAGTAANARAGAVFDFADADNFHEVTLNAAGSVQLRSRIGGAERIVANATTTAPGAKKWVHLALVRDSGHTTVMIDGVRVFDAVLQDGLQPGDIGLVTRNTSARFDDLDARGFGAGSTYRENFNDGVANSWQPLSGTWSAASKVYANTAVIPTAITVGPFNDLWDLGSQPFPVPYTFKVRMLNPYGGSGNLVGVAWVRDAKNYTEAVFSPTGEARLNTVVDGVRSTLASARYSGAGPNKWFEVEVENDANLPPQFAIQRIKVNGVQLFDRVPDLPGSGPPSLITHWAPGRFDDLRAAATTLHPVFVDFNDGVAFEFGRGTNWNYENGTLNMTAVIANNAIRFQPGWHELDDIEFRARMVNNYGSSGNLVGFTYGARGPVHYEALFSPTGVAQLRKVVKGVSTTLATASYEGGEQHQWFDAQLIQIRGRTTVKVNGVTVFNNVLQPDAAGTGNGSLGLVTHFTNASIDDVLFARIGETRYRLTQLPNLANPFGPSSNVTALNDLGEAVGESRNAGGTHTAVLWRQGQVIPLGANPLSVARGINNKSEIVGSNAGGTAFFWKNGGLRDLGASPASSQPRSEAFDINEHSQIVGASCGPSDGCPALLWQPGGAIVPLEDLPGGNLAGTALAINDGAEIVGFSQDAPVGHAAASWQGGTVESLGHDRSASDINDRGQIVGTAEEVGVQRAVTWHFFREFVRLPTPLGRFSAAASGINERGEIVGWSSRLSGQSHGTLWQEGRATDLNELIACNALPANIVLGIAWDINERGQIVVNATDTASSDSPNRAYLLTPVSAREPCN